MKSHATAKVTAASKPNSYFTPRDQRFCDYMLLGNSATSAALHVGIKVSATRAQIGQILAKPGVIEYMRIRREEMTARNIVSIDRVKEELGKLAFLNVSKIVRVEEDGTLVQDFSQATPDELQSVTSVSTKKRSIYSAKGEHLGDEVTNKVTLADKYRGLELLGRHLGMFKAEEQRVVVDVADRLLAARRRMSISDNTEDEET